MANTFSFVRDFKKWIRKGCEGGRVGSNKLGSDEKIVHGIFLTLDIITLHIVVNLKIL